MLPVQGGEPTTAKGFVPRCGRALAQAEGILALAARGARLRLEVEAIAAAAAARDDPRASRQEVTGARLLYDPDQFMPENERRARAAGHCERRAREAKVQPDQVQITGTQTALAHAHQAPPRPHWRRGDVSEPRRPCRGKVHPAPEPANHAAGGVLPGRAGIDQRAHQMYS